MKKHSYRRWRAMRRHEARGWPDPRYIRQGVRPGRDYPRPELPVTPVIKARFEDIEFDSAGKGAWPGQDDGWRR